MLNKVVETLKKAQKIAIYIHINVDCDAMGSALALKEALEQFDKKVDLFVNSSFPANFDFYGDLSFVNQKTINGKYDLAVCLDVPNEKRIGKYKYSFKKNSNGNTLCIDHHHLAKTNFCKLNFVREASSTAEILFDVLSAMNVKITDSICRNIISGILTDTGRFSHSATDKTFAVIAKLLDGSKVEMSEISNILFNSMPNEVFKIVKLAYNKLELYSDGKLGLIMLRNDDFVQNGATMDDVDILPDIPMQLKSVQFAIIASEDDKGYFRVSLRSKGDLSAKSVAETFGGGGHLNASGCKIFGEYEDVKQQLLDNTLQTLGWKQ